MQHINTPFSYGTEIRLLRASESVNGMYGSRWQKKRGADGSQSTQKNQNNCFGVGPTMPIAGFACLCVRREN